MRDKVIFGLACFVTLGSLAVWFTLDSTYFGVVSYAGAVFIYIDTWELLEYDSFEDYEVIINNQNKES